MAALAAVAGLIGMLGEARIRALNAVWWHAGGNVLVVLIQLYNWFARYTQETTAVVPKGLILSLLVIGILLFTGWKGWEMVYGVRRFRRGGTAPPSRNVEWLLVARAEKSALRRPRHRSSHHLRVVGSNLALRPTGGSANIEGHRYRLPKERIRITRIYGGTSVHLTDGSMSCGPGALTR